MKLYTTSLGNWRKAKGLGVPLLDITVKSGDKTFAPTWGILMEYKNKGKDEELYLKRFVPLMRESYVQNKNRWIEVCNMKELAIACYCSKGIFCHRHTLVSLLGSVCEQHNIMFEYAGEL